MMGWSLWVVLSCFFAATGVGCGAFGAHALKGRLSLEALQTFEVAVRYQMYHAFALLGVAFVASHVENLAVKLAGLSFCLGIFLFSGSLYALVATGVRWLGAITPLGGVALICGWIFLAWALLGRN